MTTSKIATVLLFTLTCTSYGVKIAQAQDQAVSTERSLSTTVVVPQLIRYDGAEASRSGDTVEAVFRIYSAHEGGEPLWSETQNVTIGTDGKFSVLLGASTQGGLPQTLFASGQSGWLAVSIDRGEEQPRVPLTSVPYAMKSADAETLGGLSAQNFVTQSQLAEISKDLAAQASPQITPFVTPTGSGITNDIPLWTSSTALGNSVISQGNGNISIGTQATPASLGVYGNISNTASGTYTNFTSTAYNSVNYEGPRMAFNRYEGTLAAPTVVKPNDTVGWFDFFAYDGTTADRVGQFSMFVDATPTSGIVPGRFEIETASSTGADTPRLIAYSNDNIVMSTHGGKVGIGTGSPAATLEVNGTAKFDGNITFASTQTFPITGTGGGTITGVTAGTGLTGGGTSGAVTLAIDTTKVPELSAANTFVGNQTITGTATVSGLLTAKSSITTPYIVATSALAKSNYIAAVLGNLDPTTSATYTANKNKLFAGVWGDSGQDSDEGAGVLGTTDSNQAIVGTANGGVGVWGTSQSFIGTYGSSPTFAGIYGISTSGVGTYGNSATYLGVQGVSGSSTGVEGDSTTGVGVYGSSPSANGVQGVSTSSTGVEGDSTDGTGVFGSSSNSNGVEGLSTGGSGVAGGSTDGYGVSGNSTNSSAGYFSSATTGANPMVSNPAYVPTLVATNAYGAAFEATSQESAVAAYVVAPAPSQVENSISVGFPWQGVLWADSDSDVAITGTSDEQPAAVFINNDGASPTVFAKNYNSGGPGTGLAVGAKGKSFATVIRAEGAGGVCGINTTGDVSCTGEVKTLSSTQGGSHQVETYSMQSSESWMEDFGSGQLVNGHATIPLDAVFADAANTAVEYHVFLTPEGEAQPLYVTNKTPAGFEVQENNHATDSIAFSFRIVAKRKGHEDERLVDVTERFAAEKKAIQNPDPRPAKASRQLIHPPVMLQPRAPHILAPARPLPEPTRRPGSRIAVAGTTPASELKNK
jgi:hypothetical protein